jgi:hypothetical protein
MKSAIDYLLDNVVYIDLNDEMWKNAVKTARTIERERIIDAISWFDDTGKDPEEIRGSVDDFLNYCDKLNSLV